VNGCAAAGMDRAGEHSGTDKHRGQLRRVAKAAIEL